MSKWLNRFLIYFSICTILFSFSVDAATVQLSVLSYNVYFDDSSGELRYPRIIDLINESGNDVVCLQEVTPKFFEQLQQNSKIRQQYHFFPTSLLSDYGNVILSKFPFERTGTLAVPTDMGRRFPFVNVTIEGQSIRLINVHLESLDDDRSKSMRRKQLQKIESILENKTLLVGDFNFGDEDVATNAHLANMGMTDAFSLKGNTVKEPTYNPKENPLAKQTKDWFEPPRRLDRVFSTNAFKVMDYQVIKVMHSDHYPIVVHYNLFNPDCLARREILCI